MEWSRRRQRFNHDWLKNQFLTALAHLDSTSRELVEDPAFVAHFFNAILPQWRNKREIVLELAASFEVEMSPRVLFHSDPLASNAGMQEPWIADLIDALWRARMEPERRVARLLDAVKGCDAACDALGYSPQAGDERVEVEAVQRMYKAFSALASELSEFPAAVLVL